IDRFLMYYIRTADRLQRTATCLESLDGGLDHLREVIVDDRLGICAELDAAMERHVAAYSDEWRDTLEDPERLRRFVSFVNAPRTPDPSIAFEAERDQIRPARTAPPTTGPGTTGPGTTGPGTTGPAMNGPSANEHARNEPDATGPDANGPA